MAQTRSARPRDEALAASQRGRGPRRPLQLDLERTRERLERSQWGEREWRTGDGRAARPFAFRSHGKGFSFFSVARLCLESFARHRHPICVQDLQIRVLLTAAVTEVRLYADRLRPSNASVSNERTRRAHCAI
jgi:hypothetical protein